MNNCDILGKNENKLVGGLASVDKIAPRPLRRGGIGGLRANKVGSESKCNRRPSMTYNILRRES